MFVNGNFTCCGLREIGELRTRRSPEAAMKTFCDEISPRAPYFGDLPPSNRDKFRYVIFTNTVGQKLGRKFEAYILEHKLGDVISTGYKVNPNSGHRLRVWVWTIDHVALAKWREKFMPNAPKWKPTRA